MKKLLHRAMVRIWGRDYWHYRHFPSDLHFDFDHRGVLMEYGHRSIRAHWYSSLRGRRSGRCYIVLSGPSIGCIRTPGLLAGCYNIWANGSPTLALASGISPSMYVVTDLGFISRRRADYLRYAAAAEASLVNFTGASKLLRNFAPAGNFYVFDDPASPLHRMRPPQAADRVPWSDREDSLNCIRTGQTIATTCLRAAMAMGFTEIYIFGLDLGGPARRFYREINPEPSLLARHHAEIVRELQAVAAEANRLGVSIENCSPLTKLDESVFPQADPNDVLAFIAPRRSTFDEKPAPMVEARSLFSA